MRKRSVSVGFALVGLWVVLACGALSQEKPKVVDPESPSGLDYYAQGGVVVDGVAYFTSTDGCRREGVEKSPDFPSVVAFDVRTFRKLRTYRFARTYDSTPLVFDKRDGTRLIIAHEHEKKRTTAIRRDTGEVDWISAPNQPGAYFFGYSYYQRDDGSKIILMACQNGLHAMSGETGEDLWCIERRTTGGITPCVDQQRGWVFYQCDGKVLKIRAEDGHVLQAVEVDKPNICISWNTVLVDDPHGYFVATRWYGKPEWDSAIRVYDKDLRLVWEKTALPIGKKSTLTYAEGKLVVGGGNSWSKEYSGDEWKHVTAYSIADGRVAWRLDASQFAFASIMNVPYVDGYLYAETQNGPDASQLLRIRASDGHLDEVLDYGRPVTSCATCIAAHGMILSGDLYQDGIVATRIAESSKADWPGTFGDPQTHQMASPSDPEARRVPMQELSDDDIKRQ
ncbi:MAG TPA: hypothetical protein VMY37_30370 [Thermoguttaceae bacterium]|nr:hypothetical protein [Thermoguttaceae bacterium]